MLFCHILDYLVPGVMFHRYGGLQFIDFKSELDSFCHNKLNDKLSVSCFKWVPLWGKKNPKTGVFSFFNAEATRCGLEGDIFIQWGIVSYSLFPFSCHGFSQQCPSIVKSQKKKKQSGIRLMWACTFKTVHLKLFSSFSVSLFENMPDFFFQNVVYFVSSSVSLGSLWQ